MINQLAFNISQKLKQKYPDELPSLDITRYSIKFIISNLIPVFIIAIVSLVWGQVGNAFIALVSFAALRMFSGGFHFKSAELCIVFSSVTILLIAFLGSYLDFMILYMNILSVILNLIYAPSNIKKQTRVSQKYFPVFKLISVVIVLTSFLFDNPVIATAFFVQSLLLIRLRKGGEQG